MQFFPAGEDILVTVPFARDGEAFVPDPDGLSWLLRDQNGAAGGSTDLPTVTDSLVNILVAAASNSIPDGQQFSKRYLEVRGTVGGIPFRAVTVYTLTPWINTTVTPQDVRTYLGVNRGELLDQEVDLAGAYFAVVDSVGDKAIVDTALASGTVRETAANQAILMKAVMTAVPSLALRLTASETDGSLGADRLDQPDPSFSQLYKEASLTYGVAITLLSGRVAKEWSPFTVTQPTDIITGV